MKSVLDKDNFDIESLNIPIIEKSNKGEDKRLLYIPDFEQETPTYQHVLGEFVNAFSETNTELLVYVKEDEFLEDKLNVLYGVFSIYEKDNCYINLYISP